jgi:4-hydroxy-tetrahydrodipicolinate reductase
MGRLLIAEIIAADAVLAGGIDAADAILGQDLGILAGQEALGIAATSDPAALLDAADVVVDFTVPSATRHLTNLAAEQGTALVIGTTGLDRSDQQAIEAASARIPILQAANFSIGVNLLLGLTEQTARRLGPGYDIEILEMHHRMKIDAPSGTALALGEAAARGRDAALDDLRLSLRDGITGARPAGRIGFASLRGGDVAGDHSVIFAGIGERIELTHKASNRRVFAEGAIRAALWLAGKPAGLYGMRDVLGL